MAKENVILISDDSGFISRVKKSLEKIPVQISVVDAVPSVDSPVLDLVICDQDLAIKNTGILPWVAANSNKSIYAYSHKQGTSPISVLNEIKNASHVICKSEPFETNELSTIVKNILKLETPAFEDFLAADAQIKRMEISDYALKDEILNSVREIALSLSAFTGIQDNAVTVVWEFMMNAIFDAPDALAELFAGERTENILLGDQEAIKIAIGFDQQKFVISIKDNFGTLEKLNVLKTLKRCELRGHDQVASNPTGAGIGLYMAFNCLNQLNFVVNKNVATEVIGVIYLTKRLKLFTERNKSVSFFMKNVTANADAG